MIEAEQSFHVILLCVTPPNRVTQDYWPMRFVLPALLIAFVSFPAVAQNVIYVHDGINLPAHRARGQLRAETDLKAGLEKFYVPVCTFPAADKRQIRAFEIRKALYQTSKVIMMADMCNDIVPSGSQQQAYVDGYNAVMEPAIGKRLGHEWRAVIEKQVSAVLRKHPKGNLRAGDIQFETPY